MSSGIVPVSVGEHAAALWAWGGSCAFCGQIYRKDDKGGKKASSGIPGNEGADSWSSRKNRKEGRTLKTTESPGSLCSSLLSLKLQLIIYILENLNRRGDTALGKLHLSGGLGPS